jgi:uncharacterized protein YecE (DUF72 family)
MPPEIYVGTAGWSYPDWEGVVYPSQRPRGKSELAYLADYLDAVEINMSFYRPPSAAMAEKWIKQVAGKPGFLFTAKLWQRFTHERERPWTAPEIAQFKSGIRPLHEANRFGALLMQFPWSFTASEPSRDWLSRLSEAFAEFPCVLEVRHASWDSPENREFLRRAGLNFCNIDQPHSRSSIGPTSVATGPIAYYRFHGRNAQAWFARDAGRHFEFPQGGPEQRSKGRDERYNYLYTGEELAPWAENIAVMAREVQKLFVMNNNHYRGQAVVNALQLKSSLSGKKVRVPELLAEQYPVLKEIAAPSGENARLF